MSINPNHYYSFILTVEKGKYITISFYKNEKYFEEKFKIKEIKISNLLLCVGCEVEKIDKKSNMIHNNYKYMNRFSGFIGDIFLINLHSYKERFFIQKDILDLKGKYGYSLIKSLFEQKSSKEFIISYLENTIINMEHNIGGANIFTTRYSSRHQFKLTDNTSVNVNSSNFRLIPYMDDIDYINYKNKYHEKEKLLSKHKKENQCFLNFMTNNSETNNRIIEIGSSLFNCHFNIIENTSGIIKFIEEDGIFYLLLILEYYYQILFKICKEVLGKDNNEKNIILSAEQKYN